MKLSFLILLLFMFGCVQPVPFDEQVERNRMFERLLSTATLAMRHGTDSALEEAEAALNLAAQLRPRDPRVFDGLGAIAWRRQKRLEAQKYFTKAINLDPGYARAYAHLALVEESYGNLKRAEDLYRLALEKKPLDFRSRGNLGALLLDSGRTSEGREQTLQAVSSTPDAHGVLDANLHLSGRHGHYEK